jgi:hypothetical protein
MNFSGGAITVSAALVSASSASPVTSSTAQSADLGQQEVSVAEAARLNKAAKTNQPQQ